MRDLLGRSPGTALSQAEYDADFSQREWAVDGFDSWKLERRQHFQEPRNESWRAFARGDWAEALRLIDGRRASLRALAEKAAAHDTRLLRVRVVEHPIVPYLQWELNSLRVRADCGELIRVVTAAQVARHEQDGLLPELLTLGRDVVYRIEYDEAGLAAGAVRYLDATATTRVATFIRGLYDAGEDIQDFFDRDVAHLPPPPAEDATIR